MSTIRKKIHIKTYQKSLLVFFIALILLNCSLYVIFLFNIFKTNTVYNDTTDTATAGVLPSDFWKKDKTMNNDSNMYEKYNSHTSPEGSSMFTIVILSYLSPKSLSVTLKSLCTSTVAYHPNLKEVLVYFQLRNSSGVDDELVKSILSPDYYKYNNNKSGTSAGLSYSCPVPVPFRVIGTPENLPVASATFTAIRKVTTPLVLYLECDRPVWWMPPPSHLGTAADMERKSSNRSFYYNPNVIVNRLINEAIKRLLRSNGGSASTPSTDNNNNNRAASDENIDVFRMQLYSYSDGGYSTNTSPNEDLYNNSRQLPKETYGVDYRKHCRNVLSYNSRKHNQTIKFDKLQKFLGRNGRLFIHSKSYKRLAKTQIQNTRNGIPPGICENTPKLIIKIIYGHVFYTAYCKNWKKFSEKGRSGNMKPLDAVTIRNMVFEHSEGGRYGHYEIDMGSNKNGDSFHTLKRGSTFMQKPIVRRSGKSVEDGHPDMCDPFCFIEWVEMALGPYYSAVDSNSLDGGSVKREEAHTHLPRNTTNNLPQYNSDDNDKALRSIAENLALRGVTISFINGSDYTSSDNVHNNNNKSANTHVYRTSSLPIICLTSEYCNWTNQPAMYRKEWFMKNIASPCEDTQYGRAYCLGLPGRQSAVRQEIFFKERREFWDKRKYKICLSVGAFYHFEVDNRE